MTLHYPQYPSPPPQPKEPNGLAVAAFVLALIPLGVTSVIALGLAIPALQRARKENAKGEGLAIAALAISICMLVLFVLGLMISAGLSASGDKRDESGVITEPTRLSPLDLRVGDCYGEPDGSDGGGQADGYERVYNVTAIPCDDPHLYEVYAAVEIDDDLGLESEGPYPGDDVVGPIVEEGCLELFEAFIGHPYDTSELDFGVMFPLKSGWAQGERTAICDVGEMDGRSITGSLAGAGR